MGDMPRLMDLPKHHRPPRRELKALLSAEGPEGSSPELDLQEHRGRNARWLVHSLGLALFGLVLGAVLISSGSWVLTRLPALGNSEVQFSSLTDAIDCRTAQKGERCYSDVVWAMRHRNTHPEWYIGLNRCSDFHDFQRFMHNQVLNSGARRCPAPCASDERTPPKNAAVCKVKHDKGNCHTAVPGEDCYAHVIYTKSQAERYPAWYPGITKGSSLLDVQYYLHTERMCPPPCFNQTLKAEDNITGCHTALPGDTCFADILLAKTKFIERHPSWYKGLTNESGNDEFQAFLHEQKHEGASAEKKACPAPCNHTALEAVLHHEICETAEAGDPCYESVLWGATIGIQTHPEWYRGLTERSSFEEFQAHLHKDNHTKCYFAPCPCQRPVKGDPCYRTLEWVRSFGLDLHPERFSGITKNSSLQEVQQHLHGMGTSRCGRPCKTFSEDSRSPWRPRQQW